VGEGALEDADAVFAELFGSLAGRVQAGQGHGETRRETGADMRYVGQEHTITIPLRSQDGRLTTSLGELRDTFTREYERTFGHEMDEEVEIVSLRATLRTPLPRRTAERPSLAASDGRAEASVEAYSFTRGEWTSFRVVERSGLAPAAVVSGPAILLEETATTYLDAEFEARVHEQGSLFVTDTRGE
jgi:N-methylhydantoinase A